MPPFRTQTAAAAIAVASALTLALGTGPLAHAQPADAPESVLVATPGVQSFDGSLERSDELDGGKYVDRYVLRASSGQRVTVRVETTDELDTYLQVLAVDTDDDWTNDDFGGTTRVSQLTFTAPDDGEFEINVTSFGRKESGDYTVTITADAAPVMTPVLDEPGELSDDDDRRETGQRIDWFDVDVTQGDRLLVSLESLDFDAYLVIIDPNGQRVTLDDSSRENLNPRSELLLTRSGTYRIGASCFGAEESGVYKLSVTKIDRTQITPKERRTIGVFVGISDYGGSGDLPNCAEDAERLAHAAQKYLGMAPEDCIIITNADATTGAILDALATVAESATEDDTFYFFYSGHGTRVSDDNPDPADNEPDGLDEAIAVRNGNLLDDDLAAAINAIPAGARLVVLDACNSGGFAMDLAGRGTMALLSCPADTLSLTADEVEAGGYLSDALLQALTADLASTDMNADRQISPLELTHAIQRKFNDLAPAAAIPTTRSDDGVDLSPSDWLGYQRLVIESEGLHFDQPLFGF